VRHYWCPRCGKAGWVRRCDVVPGFFRVYWEDGTVDRLVRHEDLEPGSDFGCGYDSRRKVMGAKSRTKGATFEREVARRLRDLLGEAWTVQRVPADRQRGQGGQAGDLVVTGPRRWPWVVECKSHKTFDVAQLLEPGLPGPFQGWWVQACSQALVADGLPCLVLRVPRRDLLVALPGVVEASPSVLLAVDDGVVTVGPWAVMTSALIATCQPDRRPPPHGMDHARHP